MGFWASSPGLFVIDEFIYLIAAESLVDRGSLILDNGFSELSLQTLRTALLVDGPNGLTSPYPAGITALNGIGYFISENKGIIGVNVVLGVLTLFLVQALAMRMFNDELVASTSVVIMTVCTFWPEYVFSLESHAMGVLVNTCAMYCALVALQSEDKDQRLALYWAAAGGGAIGLGVLVRADAVLVLPALLFLAVMYSKAPLKSVLAGAIGMLPGLLIASGINEFKFGTLNPLSYGSTEGGTRVEGHSAYASLLVFLFAIVVYRRFFTARSPLLIFAVAVFLAMLLQPAVVNLFVSIFKGGYALFVDSSAGRLRHDMTVDDNGLLRVQGWSKMALGQSMPWIAVLAAMPFASWRKNNGQVWNLIWVVVLLWSLTFWIRSWDGGFGSNMRYFLPLFPVLAALAAKIFVDLGRSADKPALFIFLGLVLGFCWWLAWALTGPGEWEGAGFYAGKWMLFIVAFSLILGRNNHTLCLCVLTAALTIGSINLVRDIMSAQERRESFRISNEVLANSITAPSLTIGYPVLFSFQIPVDYGFVGYRRTNGIENAASDYTIWVDDQSIDEVLAHNPKLAKTDEVLDVEMGKVTRLKLK
ncbi:hypothetical protein [Ruegeria sp. THAF57]|uniref:hypothetical protein n=1 Tax=Ruegeria sp. THAF57 TaxID=2744555 RepID=UPI001C60DCBC|nr:hypothetical protein [Ruegeria sp. THAF57]